jgi:hypothetical protein
LDVTLVPAGGRAAPIAAICGSKIRRGGQRPGFSVSTATIVDQTAKAAKIENGFMKVHASLGGSICETLFALSRRTPCSVPLVRETSRLVTPKRGGRK